MLIQLSDLSLSRNGSDPILSHVDFHAEGGDFIYITGKVGTGKTSLLKVLYGELRPSEGKAEVLGNDLFRLKRRHLPALRKKIGIVFQDFQLLRDQTVHQNLDFVLRATGWKKKQRPERIREVLEAVGMAERADCFPHELSGGEQQRICIARALLNHPQIIIADEPTANLDPETGKQIMQIFQNAREEGAAVIMVTHNLNLLGLFPGVVYRCADGQITETSSSQPENDKEDALNETTEE